MPARAVCAEFRVSQTTATARSKEIMRLLRIGPLDPRWTLLSKLTDSPAAWMIEVNGFVVDAREMSRALQEEHVGAG